MKLFSRYIWLTVRYTTYKHTHNGHGSCNIYYITNIIHNQQLKINMKEIRIIKHG